jgi:hypothetical protein
MEKPFRTSEKITLGLSIFQTMAMVAIPIVVWKLLDPALEELRYKKAPVVTENVSIDRQAKLRDYQFAIQNVGKFPLEHVTLLITWHHPEVEVPKQVCRDDTGNAPCVSIRPHMPLDLKAGEGGHFSRVELHNPIPGETGVVVTLSAIPIKQEGQHSVDIRAAVSSDSGSTIPECAYFGTRSRPDRGGYVDSQCYGIQGIDTD